MVLCNVWVDRVVIRPYVTKNIRIPHPKRMEMFADTFVKMLMGVE
jgi:hypothetical protein